MPAIISSRRAVDRLSSERKRIQTQDLRRTFLLRGLNIRPVLVEKVADVRFAGKGDQLVILRNILPVIDKLKLENLRNNNLHLRTLQELSLLTTLASQR